MGNNSSISQNSLGLCFEVLPKQYEGMEGPNVIRFMPVLDAAFSSSLGQSLTGRLDSVEAVVRGHVPGEPGTDQVQQLLNGLGGSSFVHLDQRSQSIAKAIFDRATRLRVL